MRRRRLGPNGPEVSAIGLGCMTMSGVYGVREDADAMETLECALALGVDFLDTADVYGPFHNEELIGGFLRGRRDRVFLATKFGIARDVSTGAPRINGTPDYVRSAAEASLRRLQTDHIDLYYLHRVDPATPIEETVGAMAALVQAGKVLHIGLSEASAATLERACEVHPVTALQSEYSLWTREPEDGVLTACRRLGVGFVPYSPLGRGFLTGTLSRLDEMPDGDWRRGNPRFQGENFDANLALAAAIRDLASTKGCTPAQLALAWVLAQGEHIVPIPGTKRRSYLEQNVGALEVSLTPADLAAIGAAFPRNAAVGDRYPAAMQRSLNG
jgi:aryl-alcohol dehydrogenase-like predicted oxidoreductase